VRKGAVKLLRSALQNKEDTQVALNLARATFEQTLPLIRFIDKASNEALHEYLIDLVAYLKDIFPESHEERARQVLLNLVDFITKGTDPAVMNLLLKTVQMLATRYPALVNSEWPRYFGVLQDRLRSHTLAGDVRIFITDLLRVILAAAERPVVEQYGPQIVAIFDKAKNGKEYLSSYLLLSTFYGVISHHTIGSLQKEVSDTCETLIEVFDTKVEMKLRKIIIEAFAPLIKLREMIKKPTFLRLLKIILNSFSFEGLHLSCINSLQSFGGNNGELDPDISSVMEGVVLKLVELFHSKNKIYQINIIKVLEALEEDSLLKLSEQTRGHILNGFTLVIEKCDQSTSRLISSFLIKFHDKYRNHAESGVCLTKLRSFVSEDHALEEDFLANLIEIHVRYIAQGEFRKEVDGMYESIKNNPNANTDHSALFLSILFLRCTDVSNLVKTLAEEIVSKRSKNFCLSLSLLGHLGVASDISKEERLIKALVGYTDSPEAKIKFNAIKCLTGLAIPNLELFKPTLKSSVMSTVEKRIFFFSAVQILFDHLPKEVTEDSQLNFLHYLENLVETVEPSEQSDLFKAIGKILKHNPTRIEHGLAKYASNKKPVYLLLVNSVSKHIFDKSLDIQEFPVCLKTLTSSLSHEDIEVQASALIAIDAIHHSSPSAIEKLLNIDFSKILAERMRFNEALVEKIDMGSFKHVIDKGLPLRKASFSFIHRMSLNPMFNIQPFLQSIIQGLGKPLVNH
jgi:hypothetical protein